MKNQYEIDFQQGYDAANDEWLDRMDKIRAEIEFEVDHRTNMLCAEDVFAILDKHKAESEGTDADSN